MEEDILDNRKEIQKNHYDSLASQVDELVEPWEFASSDHILSTPYKFTRQWFSKRDLVGKKLLDFGCGARALSIDMLLDSGAFVTGIDISPESIEKARQRSKIKNVSERYTFDVGDCESLEFKNGYFDYILSTGTLSCLRLDVAYLEMSRVLKPDGHVVVIDTLGHNPLLNLNRKLKLKRGLKTEWSVNHTIKLKNIRAAYEYFSDVEIYWFGLATPILSPIISKFLGDSKYLKRVIRGLDQMLVSLPFFKKYAFKVVCFFSSPKKPVKPYF